MEIEYCRMNQSHIADVAHLEQLCFTIPWSAHAFEMELKNSVAYYMVAISDGQVIGYGGVWQVVDEGHITNIAVHPQYRKMGIGSGVLDQLITYAHEKVFKFLTLEVRKSNYAAQNLYHKHGFEHVGIRPRYYQDNNEDAILMTKILV